MINHLYLDEEAVFEKGKIPKGQRHIEFGEDYKIALIMILPRGKDSTDDPPIAFKEWTNGEKHAIGKAVEYMEGITNGYRESTKPTYNIHIHGFGITTFDIPMLWSRYSKFYGHPDQYRLANLLRQEIRDWHTLVKSEPCSGWSGLSLENITNTFESEGIFDILKSAKPQFRFWTHYPRERAMNYEEIQEAYDTENFKDILAHCEADLYACESISLVFQYIKERNYGVILDALKHCVMPKS